MAIEIHPLTRVIGAEIRGVDLRLPLRADEVAAIERALLEHLVVFFREQFLSDAQQRDFAAHFGALEPYVLAPAVNPEVPELHTLRFDDGAAARGSRVDCWHTDGSFMRCPPLGTVLRAVELPECGGDTCWASMVAAYQALSPPIQQMLAGLEAEHDFMKISYTTFDDCEDPAAELAKLRSRYPVMRHPVVRTHPVTGRKLLYVNRNYVTRLVGLSERENEILLPFLFDHVRDPLFQCRFRWAPGSIAFWDNRATQHYGVPDYQSRRAMHRLVISGDQPR